MSEKISRRNSCALLPWVQLPQACWPAAATAQLLAAPLPALLPGTYTAGTYSATATGINTTTPVTVTMTFSADAITDVQIDVANETKATVPTSPTRW